jgi:hypothetical protein
MVGMRVGDYGAFNGLPGIDVKIPGGAVNTTVCKAEYGLHG